MKSLIILFASIIMNGCGANKSLASASNNDTVATSEKVAQQQPPKVIKYTAQTRGYFYEATIKNDSVFVQNQYNGKTFGQPCSQNDIETIGAALKSCDISKIAEHAAPSTKRHTDAAAIATIVVMDGDKEYKSQNFDSGNPPKALKALVDSVVEAAKAVKTEKE